MPQPPPIDSRTAKDIAEQVQNLLPQYTQNFEEANGDRQLQGISAALVNIFARYAEIIIQRLNKVPYKNFLAFLDLLGVSQTPPQPARAPLLFTLATDSDVDAFVPAGTQVAALLDDDESQQVIFETERDLVVTAAQLKYIFVREPEKDFYSNYTNDNITTYNNENVQEVSAFEGQKPIEHYFDIINNILLKHSDLQTLTLDFELKENLQNSEIRLAWEVCNGLQCFSIPNSNIEDQTSNLTRSGTIIFNNFNEVSKEIYQLDNSDNLDNLDNLNTKYLLRCQSQTPIFSSSQVPFINNVNLQATFDHTQQRIEQAFTNLLSIDLSKPFFPFGEEPKFGDTLYFANQEAFSKSGATVTLHINLSDIASAGIPLPIENKDPNVILEWEIWTNKGWFSVGTSAAEDTEDPPPLSPPEVTFRDETRAFTFLDSNPDSDPVVEFILPESEKLLPTTVNGIENFWLRVRIKSGNYGEDAHYERDENTFGGFSLVPASFKPPLINSLKVDYTLTTSPQLPEVIETYNDFSRQIIPPDSGFQPFQSNTDTQPTLYLGFSIPENRLSFPNRTISIYFQMADVLYNPDITTNHSSANSLSSKSSPRLTWEYWSKETNKWTNLVVQDETEGLTHSGLVEFLPPEDFGDKKEFDLPENLYWLRVRRELDFGEYSQQPLLKRVLLNTTSAIQALTIANEILGSSNGSESQSFSTTQSPVLEGEYLEVKEPEMPRNQEQESIKELHGENAISEVLDETGRPEEIWVRWSEVSDFYGSGSRDRHYIIDRNSGEIRFGDGLRGLIPPLGTANVRMKRYQAIGGVVGNQPENTIIQLQTTIPYIDSVTNPEAATGGADIQTLDSLIELGPRTVRHGGRAVTFEDYEDLAMQATSEVARAKAIPLLNLSTNPLYIQTFKPLVDQNLSFEPPISPGEVSIIIVPDTSDLKPLPSQELMERVHDYLNIHAIGSVKIWVVGPVYVEVSVTTTIVPTSLEKASAVEQAINKALTEFLHPLSGGFDKLGWKFGRRPYLSDFYALIEALPDVDYVHSLSIQPNENPPEEIQEIFKTQRFLVYSGQHTINLLFA